MRSAKDLKGMVNESRVRGKSTNGSASNTRAITEDVEGENARPYESNPAGGSEGYNFVRNKQVGGAAYASAATDGDDTMKKLRKLEVLAASDKETIEA